MNLSTAEFGDPAIWIPGLVAVLGGGGILVWLLAFLHKKLQIFTRGTVGFMIVAVMITSVLSLVERAQTIRDTRDAALNNARRQTALQFLTSWLNGRDDFREVVWPDATATLAASAQDAKNRLIAFAISTTGVDADAPVRVAAIAFDEPYFYSPQDEFRYRAAMMVGESPVILEGIVTTSQSQPAFVTMFRASPTKVAYGAKWADIYFQADWSNPDFEAKAKELSFEKSRSRKAKPRRN